jgi:hypothetical protein
MKKQIILIAFFTVGIALIEACSCFTTCGCGGATDGPDYFDFKKMTLEHKQGIGTEVLRLIIQPDSIQYLAMETARPLWNTWVSSAYACSPEEPGWAGLKFPLTQIKITADQVFNDTLPAGATLNSLFQMSTGFVTQEDTELPSSQLGTLNDLSRFPPFGSGPFGLYLISKAMPASTSLPFKFTVSLTKSDSSEVSITSEEIFF